MALTFKPPVFVGVVQQGGQVQLQQKELQGLNAHFNGIGQPFAPSQCCTSDCYMWDMHFQHDTKDMPWAEACPHLQKAVQQT
jgi:hypothetical protein